mmetsp:Transcript_21462/g.31777  ORF Transcript_21462/g.31777 Transcript_21462/m.31777 type:complete len:477 (+) Transcript_21462:814-2244(+)
MGHHFFLAILCWASFRAFSLGFTCQGISNGAKFHSHLHNHYGTDSILHQTEESSEAEEPFEYDADPISDSSQSGNVLNGEEFPSDKELARLPSGKKGGFKVTKIYHISSFPVQIQEALTLLDPQNYPTLTRARKACRKGSILIHNGPIENNSLDAFRSKEQCHRARVGDIIEKGDVIGVQTMMGTFKKKRCYPNITYSRPRFTLSILYEDDHLAIVDKPAGISMYGQRRSRSGALSRRTLRDILPYCLTPPASGTPGQALKRPMAVHRLDTPTSGVVVVAKTKLAMDSLYQQFQERRVVKTYFAIVNGVPKNCVPMDGEAAAESGNWNIVDYPLGGKHAITRWRTVRSARSLNSKDGTLTLIEVQPKTGRYHQIRRHIAWICRRPLVGDALYAGKLQAPRFLRNGLYLCSNGVSIEHPYFNTIAGRLDWEDLDSSLDQNIRLFEDQSSIILTVQKEMPKRFEKLLDGEEVWANRNL